ncbi:MAG: response regulator, partial [Candidatus Aminicenantes bacterium]|nr:response regulator [Candidatus Aminicenantes bacterium]
MSDKILIVDDNEDMQSILSNALKEEGYETMVTGSGEDALLEVRKNPPQLVLLDMKLPGMNGMKVMEEIRKIDK